MEFNSKKIGIWGLGIVGNAALRFFYNVGAQLVVMDTNEPTPEQAIMLQRYDARFFLQKDLNLFFDATDAVLVSPGINRSAFDLPDNITWLSELDIFKQFWRNKIIAITGSTGKTSVTSMLASCLRAAGKTVALGGNIGIGILDLLNDQQACDYAVVELSSFQLESCVTFAPDLALWTNFSDNHLDRHINREAYFDAKYNIMAHQNGMQTAIIPEEIASFLRSKPYKGTLIWYTTSTHLAKTPGYCLGPTSVMYHNGNTIHTIHNRNDIPHTSFMNNWMLVIGAMHTLGIQIPALASCPLKLPEHRLEYLGVVNGAHFYNDSKSTTTLSTKAAIDKFKGEPIVIFIGGTSKGVDRSESITQISHKARLIYCFGSEASYLASFARGCPAHSFQTLEEAFAHYTHTMVQQRDIVLFSPAGASFDLYRNYEQRGAHFKRLVHEYAQQSTQAILDCA